MRVIQSIDEGLQRAKNHSNNEKNSIHNVRMYLYDEDDEDESEDCDCVRIERPFVPMNVGADP